MPTVDHDALVAASPAEVWEFVRDMDNWAPFITGYQHHTKLNERESEWFLKGELGGLTRTAQFNVRILDWNEPDGVTFELTGINEPVTGSGEFVVSKIERDDRMATEPAVPLPEKTLHLFDRLWRFLFDHLFKTGAKNPIPSADPRACGTTLRFSVTVSARGMSGPVLNILIAPMLKPVAEDLATKIAAAISGAQMHTT